MEYFSDSSDILTENDIISASYSTEFNSSNIEIVNNITTSNTLQLFDTSESTESEFEFQYSNNESFFDTFDDSSDNFTHYIITTEQNDIINKYNLLLDTHYNTLHCSICHIVLTETFQRHFKMNHSIKITAKDAIVLVPLLKIYPAFSNVFPVRPFQHIPILNGFNCSRCFHCSVSLIAIRQHCIREHSIHCYNGCKLQKISLKNTSLTYVRISSEYQDENHGQFTKNSILAQFKDTVQSSLPKDNFNQKNLFYAKYNWYPEPGGIDLFSNFDIEKAMEFPKSTSIQYHFFTQLLNFFIAELESVNSLSPELTVLLDDCDSSGSFRYLTTRNSRRQYAIEFSHFVLFTIRIYRDSPSNFILDERVQITVQSLSESMTSDSIVALLSTVIRQVPINTPELSMLMLLFVRFWCKNSNGSLQHPNNIARICSKLIYLCKLTLLLELDTFPDYSFVQKVAYIKRNRVFALENGCYNRGILTRIRSDAWACNSNSEIIGRISIPDLNRRFDIVYDGVLLKLVSLQNVFYVAYSKCMELQHKILDGLNAGIDLSKIVDHFSNNAFGYGFKYTENANVQLEIASALLLHLNSTGKINEYVHAIHDDSIIWNTQKAKQVLTLYDNFIENLLLVVHIGSGIPARGSELATYSIVNGESSSRTVRIMDNLVYFLPSYNKTRQLTVKDRIIARFLDSKCSKLVAIDILIVRPFISKLAVCIYGSIGTVYLKNLFVLKGISLTGEKIGCIFVNLFARYAGVHISISEYRDIAKYYCNMLNIERLSQLENEISDEYGNALVDFDSQAGHSESISNMYYGLSTNESNLVREHQLAKFKFISLLWHKKILQVNSTTNLSKRKLDTVTSDCEYPNASRLLENCTVESSGSALPSSVASDVLIQLYGPGADFKLPEQKLAVEHVLRTNKDLLCVLPTGAGKSILFFACCLHNLSKSVIVIVPLLALIDDLKSRFSAFGLSTCECINEFTSQNAILLTPEKVCGPSFANFLSKIYYSGQLSKIFIDELHLISTDSSYRTNLLQLSFIRTVPVPIIALTATCPEWIQRDIIHRVYNDIPPTVIRAQTNRKNISYSVFPEKSMQSLHNLVAFCLFNCSEHDRIIVYFNSIRELKSIESHLSSNGIYCSIYYSNITVQEKNSNFDSWKSGTNIVMLCTSSFGLGIDYKSVKFVIMYGLPYSFEDYIQQSGRAGRDGSVSYSFLLYNEFIESKRLQSISIKNFHSSSLEYENLKRMIGFADNTSVCSRKLISTYFDNVQVDCNSLIGCSKCKICLDNEASSSECTANDNALLQKQVSITQRNINSNRIFATQLKSMLELLKNKCMLCYVQDGNLVEHEISNCQKLYRRCMQCFQRNHVVRQCTLPLVKVKNICCHCHLPNYFEGQEFHEDDFTVNCYKGILSNFGAALYEFHHDLIPVHYDSKTYWHWLFRGCENRISNVCDLFVKFGVNKNTV